MHAGDAKLSGATLRGPTVDCLIASLQRATRNPTISFQFMVSGDAVAVETASHSLQD